MGLGKTGTLIALIMSATFKEGQIGAGGIRKILYVVPTTTVLSIYGKIEAWARGSNYWPRKDHKTPVWMIPPASAVKHGSKSKTTATLT
jgi:hypothetical protein